MTRSGAGWNRDQDDPMTLRPFLMPTVIACAALAGCGDGVRISSTHSDNDKARGVLKVVQVLQCPQTLGSLTRKGSASSEGTVCTYVGHKGAEVSLHLVPLDGDTPADVLKAFERRLSGDLPEAVAQLRAAAEADEARVQAETARAAAETARHAADAAAGGHTDAAQAEARPATTPDRASVRAPGVRIETEGEDASVRLPGVQIETKGDHSSVRIGGFHIDADDSNGSARVSGSSGDGDDVRINAHADSAEVRAHAAGPATRASWILTNNNPSGSGWRMVAYEARGPVGGPLVVATVRSRDANRGRVMEDARDLVSLNVGE